MATRSNERPSDEEVWRFYIKSRWIATLMTLCLISLGIAFACLFGWMLEQSSGWLIGFVFCLIVAATGIGVIALLTRSFKK